MKHIYLIAASFLFLSTEISAQVLMQFNPAVDGLSLDRIGNVRIQYTAPGNSNARLDIVVTKNGGGGALVKVSTTPFILRPGLNIPGPQVMAAARYTFQQSAMGQSLAQTHRFSNGEYEYCYELTLVDGKSPTDFFENCFDFDLQVLTPLVLINPYDREVTCDRRPNFLWQPELPMQPGMTYTLILSEEMVGQNKTEAINFNKALVFQSGIAGNSLTYPPQAPNLDSNRTFAWQVWGILDNAIVTKSEIWEFIVQCSGDTVQMNKDSYRELTSDLDASSYMAQGFLHFSFYNSYGPYHMNYSMVDLSKQNKIIKNLPDEVVLHGHNKFDLDLTDLGMNSGDQYLLKVKTIDGKTLQLKFVYAEP